MVATPLEGNRAARVDAPAPALSTVRDTYAALKPGLVRDLPDVEVLRYPSLASAWDDFCAADRREAGWRDACRLPGFLGDPLFDGLDIGRYSTPLNGQTYREIGGRLYISAKTVEHHVSRMRQRLGASSRSDLLDRLRAELVQGA